MSNKTDVFKTFHSLLMESVEQKTSPTIFVKEEEAKEDVEICPNYNKNNDMLEHSEPQGDIKTETDKKK